MTLFPHSRKCSGMWQRPLTSDLDSKFHLSKTVNGTCLKNDRPGSRHRESDLTLTEPDETLCRYLSSGRCTFIVYHQTAERGSFVSLVLQGGAQLDLLTRDLGNLEACTAPLALRQRSWNKYCSWVSFVVSQDALSCCGEALPSVLLAWGGRTISTVYISGLRTFTLKIQTRKIWLSYCLLLRAHPFLIKQQKSLTDLSCHRQPGKTNLSKQNTLHLKPRWWTSRKLTALSAHYWSDWTGSWPSCAVWWLDYPLAPGYCLCKQAEQMSSRW